MLFTILFVTLEPLNVCMWLYTRWYPVKKKLPCSSPCVLHGDLGVPPTEEEGSLCVDICIGGNRS